MTNQKKIIKGDCTLVLPKLKGRFDLIIVDPPYNEGFTKNFDLLRSKLNKNGQILWFVQPTELYDLPEKPKQILVWKEPYSPKPIRRKYREFLDVIAWYAYGEYTFNKLLWNLMNSVFEDVVIRDKRLHKWEKPSTLLERLVLVHTNKGQKVLEPFMGTNNLKEICSKHKRIFTGIKL